ncbi:MAG: M1 family metallopeptidase, partial [Calditrichaceae bacterium]
NHSDYDIKVELTPSSRLISGSANIIYFNDSPDTLKQMVFRLYPDIFKKGQTRDFNLDPGDINKGMSITYLKIDDQEYNEIQIDTSDFRKGTNLVVDLDDVIYPSGQSNINVKWHFTTSINRNVRMGAYDSTSFMIAFWYPQIAVYDDVDEWDRYSYTGLQEFYNDFNNYEVDITMPKDFLVWATGELKNTDDVLNKSFYNKYKKALESDDIISIVNVDDLKSGGITKDKNKLTWKFEAKKVPDFAFATSDHYLWDQTSIQVGPDKIHVKVGAAYKQESEDFYKVAEIAKKAIDYFSNQMPGVPYPWPSMTVFNGSGGMEFPMMVNDGSTQTMPRTVSLTSHEIAHTYFPFYMGTNERKYAWMDEGWAVMLPFGFVLQEAPDYDRRAVIATEYANVVGKELDLPTMVPSVAYGGQIYRPSYRGASYTKAGMAYQMLIDLLGEELFKKALHTYMDRWHGKHPIPYDFFFTFNDVVGEDMSWFWNPWFFEPGYPDLCIKSVEEDDNEMNVTIQRLGNVPVPVSIIVVYEDNSENVIEKKADVWKNGDDEITLKIDNYKNAIKLILGNKYIPDINFKNNTFLINK